MRFTSRQLEQVTRYASTLHSETVKAGRAIDQILKSGQLSNADYFKLSEALDVLLAIEERLNA